MVSPIQNLSLITYLIFRADHLSHPTVMELTEAHPNAQFMVGLGLKKWFQECGIKNVVEMDWWNDVDLTLSPTTGEKHISSTSVNSESPPTLDITARISCLPCQHTSARTAFDKGATLWCSWAVSSGGKSVVRIIGSLNSHSRAQLCFLLLCPPFAPNPS